MKKHTRHLTPEEIESLTLSPQPRAARRRHRHVAACEDCRAELAAARRLHGALAELGSFAPRDGFSDRVMERVRLPNPVPVRVRVPVHVQVGRSLRAHWVAATTLASGGAATAGVLLAWALRFPEVSPPALAGFLAEQTVARAWELVLNGMQLVYESGVVGTLDQLGSGLTMGSAAAGLATLTLMAIGSLSVMRRLLSEANTQLVAVR